MPLVLTLHGGGKKLDDLRELKGEVSLRELLEMKGLPASCTVGDWLRRMGRGGAGLSYRLNSLTILLISIMPSLPIGRSYPKRWYLAITSEDKQRTTSKNS